MKTTVDVTKALADQTRLDILHRLAEGSASVAELVVFSDVSQSKVSNHLLALRSSGLVTRAKSGRKQIYSLANSNVLVLLESLAALSRPRNSQTSDSKLAYARTCYDHLAGMIGVEVFHRLLESSVIIRDEADPSLITLGERGESFFQKLGVELEAVTRAKRRFATSCLDWTEGESHLGGSLGAALCDRLIQRGYIVRQPGTRAVTITRKGQKVISRW